MAVAPLLSSPLAARFTPIGQEVYSGLTARPKTLSPWLFYDEQGSRLFEQITALPEYYLTRTERQIFAQHADAILACAAEGEPLAVIELGAGTASKTGLLLAAALRRQGTLDYYPIDVSETALDEAKQNLQQRLPGLAVHPRVADYTEGLGLPCADNIAAAAANPAHRSLVLYIGSSIGNFEPAAAASLLRTVRAELASGDRLLLGADLVKAPELLKAAYNDAAGVTAAFNKNILSRINSELGSDFILTAFKHQACWNREQSRMEMHLASTRQQSVRIPALELELSFAAGETIHTENSYKFTDAQIAGLFSLAGFEPRQEWKDPQGWFGVYLAEAI